MTGTLRGAPAGSDVLTPPTLYRLQRSPFGPNSPYRSANNHHHCTGRRPRNRILISVAVLNQLTQLKGKVHTVHQRTLESVPHDATNTSHNKDRGEPQTSRNGQPFRARNKEYGEARPQPNENSEPGIAQHLLPAHTQSRLLAIDKVAQVDVIKCPAPIFIHLYTHERSPHSASSPQE